MDVLAFQYPQSDRVVCNVPGPVEERLFVVFQYPQSDRVVCNTRRPRPATSPRRLSVSGIGSSSLQRVPASATRSRCPLSVSAIGSSSLQPGQVGGLDLRGSSFQYPQSDRVVCNDLEVGLVSLDYVNFQYPQSDRVVCNDWP